MRPLPVCTHSCSEGLVSPHVTVTGSPSEACLRSQGARGRVPSRPGMSRSRRNALLSPLAQICFWLQGRSSTRLPSGSLRPFSADLVLAPVLCSAGVLCSSLAHQIRKLVQLGEKCSVFSWLFFSWTSFPTWSAGWPQKYFCYH